MIQLLTLSIHQRWCPNAAFTKTAEKFPIEIALCMINYKDHFSDSQGQVS